MHLRATDNPAQSGARDRRRKDRRLLRVSQNAPRSEARPKPRDCGRSRLSTDKGSRPHSAALSRRIGRNKRTMTIKIASAPKVKAHNVRATLHNRKRCYNGHAMAGDNVDQYKAKGVPGYAKSERTKPAQVRWIGCRRCRKDARTRWRIKNARKIIAARNAQRKEAKAALAGAFARKQARKVAPKGDAPMFSYKDAKPEAQVAHMVKRTVARKAARKARVA